MIKKPVVLVLGAGASQPYGYPLGSELRKLLCAPRPELASLLAAAGHDRKAIDHFAEEFRFSNLASIDVFLERRPNLAPLGRSLIAGIIIERDLSSRGRAGDWYEYLWQQLTRDAPTIDAFKGNYLQVVTFNYDTSFERFLINSIRASYDVTLDVASAAFEATIAVVHVHGKIPTKLAGRFVEPIELTSETIKTYSDQIITLHQGEDNSPEFSTARHFLGKAEQVMFLGFGFHQENMRRLHVDDWIYQKRKVVGSVRGLVGQEVDRVGRMLKPANGIGIAILQDRDCLDLARHHVGMFD